MFLQFHIISCNDCFEYISDINFYCQFYNFKKEYKDYLENKIALYNMSAGLMKKLTLRFQVYKKWMEFINSFTFYCSRHGRNPMGESPWSALAVGKT